LDFVGVTFCKYRFFQKWGNHPMIPADPFSIMLIKRGVNIMIKLDFYLVINRPLSGTFEFVTNMENMPQWASGIVKSQRITPECEVGATFRLTAKPPIGSPIISDYHFTEFERNQKFSATGMVGPIPFRETWLFESLGAGTRIHQHVKLTPNGLLRFFRPLLHFIFKVLIRLDLKRLKQVIETVGASRESDLPTGAKFQNGEFTR
jgi:hypothetical protein